MSRRRAGATALVLLAVTAALVVLLVVLFRQAWPPVVVAVLLGVPGLYLTWAALPDAVKVLPPGRSTRRWDPVELGVHRVIGGGPMPTYICRPHDELLRAVLDPAVRASRLVVVRGESSTGKTRAAYEAVRDRLSGWQLDYPRDPGALAVRLDAGISARTVLWLGELRHYAGVDGGAVVLGRLADLLDGEGHLIITTIWLEDWAAYIAAARAGPGAADSAGTAGRLLDPLPELNWEDRDRIDPARGGVIDVPGEFTDDDLQKVASAGDPVLAGAAADAAHAGQGRRVTQYLAGAPALLDHWAGRGGDPYGQAVITAAMDATRLGHASPLPGALLQEAAVGYLTDSQRTKASSTWRDGALDWAQEELKGAVRALQPVPPPSGTGVAGYRVADYLDQQGRRIRREQIPPASFWAAAASYADPADLTTLAEVAGNRGLLRDAARLYKQAGANGDGWAAASLVDLLHTVQPGDQRPADWAAAHVSLDDTFGVLSLRFALRRAGATGQAAALATRAGADASLNTSVDVLAMARISHEQHVADVTGRDLTIFDDLSILYDLSTRLDLSIRDDLSEVVRTLYALHEAGATAQVTALASRAAAGVSLDDPLGMASLLHALHEAGAISQVTTLLDRDPAARASLDQPRAVAALLHALREAGAAGQVTALASRAAAQASLDDSWSVALLLHALQVTGARAQTSELIERLPAAGMFALFCEQEGRGAQFQFGREVDGSPARRWAWTDLG